MCVHACVCVYECVRVVYACVRVRVCVCVCLFNKGLDADLMHPRRHVVTRPKLHHLHAHFLTATHTATRTAPPTATRTAPHTTTHTATRTTTTRPNLHYLQAHRLTKYMENVHRERVRRGVMLRARKRFRKIQTERARG